MHSASFLSFIHRQPHKQLTRSAFFLLTAAIPREDSAARISNFTESLRAKLPGCPVQFGYWSFPFMMCPGYPLWWQVGNVSLWWKPDNKENSLHMCAKSSLPVGWWLYPILYGQCHTKENWSEKKGRTKLYICCYQKLPLPHSAFNFQQLHNLQEEKRTFQFYTRNGCREIQYLLHTCIKFFIWCNKTFDFE